jgi:WD40 repeat protein
VRSRRPPLGLATEEGDSPQLEHRTNVNAIAISPDGSTLLTGAQDGRARLWSMRTGELLRPPLDHPAPVLHVAYRPDGGAFLTAGADNLVRLFDSRTAERSSPLRQDGPVDRAIQPGRAAGVAAPATNGWAALWDATTGRRMGRPPFGHAVPTSPSVPMAQIGVRRSRPRVEVWSPPTTPRCTASAHEHDVDVAFSDGRLVSSCYDSSFAALYASVGHRIRRSL